MAILKNSVEEKFNLQMQICNMKDKLLKNSNFKEIIRLFIRALTIFNLKINQLILKELWEIRRL
jgi:hypothetical protein